MFLWKLYTNGLFRELVWKTWNHKPSTEEVFEAASKVEHFPKVMIRSEAEGIYSVRDAADPSFIFGYATPI